MQLLIRSIALETSDIRLFELVHPQRLDLPAFTAGSHVDLTVGVGIVRQYSLCNDPAERHRYTIAVLRSATSRGGSAALHERVLVGDLVEVSPPRNTFPLVEGARHSILIAGGIGVTPLLAMARRLVTLGASFDLHMCTRSTSATPFVAELCGLAGGDVRLHHDAGIPTRGLDVTGLLTEVPGDTHVYCCGPEGLMDAVANATVRWPAGFVHFERFAPPATALERPDPESFEIELASTQRVYAVPAQQSMLAVLRDAGVCIPSSCETGVCGSCATRYLAGEPDHRDFVLGDEERRDTLTPCVSRAYPGTRLVLDL